MLPQLKSNGLAALQRCGAFAVLRRAQRRRCVVIAYHGVLSSARPESDYLDYNFLDREAFAEQVRHLRRHYQPVTLTQFAAAVQRREPLPERAVLVTFDDGFANNYRVALPILKAHEVPFAVFLTTGMIDRPHAQLWSERVSRAVYLSREPQVQLELGARTYNFQLEGPAARERASRSLVALLKRTPPAVREPHLRAIEAAFGWSELSAAERERYQFLTWREVGEMAAAGVEFGSHTVTHPILSTLDDEALQRELVDSKREIERRTGRPCDTFAYPNGGRGDFGVREQRALQQAGYCCAFALLGGLVGPDADPFAIERVNIGRDFSLAMFDAALTGVLGAVRKVRLGLQPSRAGAPDLAAPELDYVG